MNHFCDGCEFELRPHQRIVVVMFLPDRHAKPLRQHISVFHAECYKHPTILIPLGVDDGQPPATAPLNTPPPASKQGRE